MTSAPPTKVLIVTYYWPPFGTSGVQRWLKFVKYLPQSGIQPYVYTPENPAGEAVDNSLLADVPVEAEIIKLPIWEPYHIFQRLSGIFGKKPKPSDFITTGKKNLWQGITSWVRGNLLIPDARKFWVKPSVLFLDDLIRTNGIPVLITTGPPHSMHLIGLALKKKNPGIRWLADFRDPWSEWDLLDTLSLSGWARRRHQSLEREVLQTADAVITIAPYHQERLTQLGGRSVHLITNGFDEEDFKNVTHVRTSHFTIRHLGVVDELRDPRPVMEAIEQLLVENPSREAQIRVEFIGNVNRRFIDWVQQSGPLNRVTRFVAHIPHAQVLEKYGATDLQLLVLAHTAIAPGNLPGKFFEYLASGNPVLAIGPPDGDAAQILRDTKAGVMVDRGDRAGLRAALETYISKWEQGGVTDNRSVGRFSRKALTQQLVEIIQTVLK